MLLDAIEKLVRRCGMSEEEALEAANDLLDTANSHQIAAFLMLLRSKGESADELIGLIRAVRKKSIALAVDRPILDIVGTGGDRARTLNISTGSALLAAACGIPIVKHGNRAVSSQCGAADVLEELGYRFHTRSEDLQESLRKTNFAFCFAPDFYPALQAVREVRKALNMPTAFHLIGPLLNPAGIDHLMVGVYDPALVDLIAEVLFRLGTKKSLVFHGQGIDELSCIGRSRAILVTHEAKTSIEINPSELGLKPCTIDDLRGCDAPFNARILKETLFGKENRLSDTLILNAGVALFLYGSVPTIQSGVDRARVRLGQGQIIKRNFLHERIQNKTGVRVRKSLKAAIQNRPGAIIAEIKRASPSVGQIAEISHPIEKAKEYVDAGAAAISVLIDPAFGGSIEDLKDVAIASSVPVLCKGFLLDMEQIAMAALSGADAVLLIVSALKGETAKFVHAAHLFGMEALVEVHHKEELSIAVNAQADLIGVNQRDLSDFSMHPELFQQLIARIPSEMVKIAESGIRSKEEADQLFTMGYDGVLIGEALSRKTIILGGDHVD
jgi:anthranilate phosphoribosyltransferase